MVTFYRARMLYLANQCIAWRSRSLGVAVEQTNTNIICAARGTSRSCSVSTTQEQAFFSPSKNTNGGECEPTIEGCVLLAGQLFLLWCWGVKTPVARAKVSVRELPPVFVVSQSGCKPPTINAIPVRSKISSDQYGGRNTASTVNK